jgi:antitoxin (DNA-binding transcriptional repressor) of toxin-antitoxin stability system
MARTVSIVEARRQLGRLAEEVGRTRQSIVLTRRGRAVARISPEPAAVSRGGRGYDAFAPLRGTVTLECSFHDLKRAIRGLRGEFARNLERRATRIAPNRGRRG